MESDTDIYEDLYLKLHKKLSSGKVKADLGGHFGFELGELDDLNSRMGKRLIEFTSTEMSTSLNFAAATLHARDSIPLKEARDIILEKPLEPIKSRIDCPECGKYITIFYDGNRLYIDEPCDNPGGIKPWDIEIDVPSGKLVFRNDMRDIFPTNQDFYVNHTSQIKMCEEHYASIGMFHVFVGNTCPKIYNFDDRVVVGRYPEDAWNKGTKEYIDCPEKEFNVGYICTDLWWFSACDYDDFMKRTALDDMDVVVELKQGPGRYRLTSCYAASKNEDLKEFAVITKV